MKDEMNIVSGFTRGIVGKLIRAYIRKKFDIATDITLNGLTCSVIDGKSHIHLDLDAVLEKDELLVLLKRMGIS